MDGQKASWIEEQERIKNNRSKENEIEDLAKNLKDHLSSYLYFKETKQLLERYGYTVEIYGDGCFPRLRVFKEVTID
ncbi:MAG: hypothetical protein ACOC1K_05515 [Nanoarchaeota archaeon]